MPKHFETLDSIIQHYLDRRRAASMLSAREAVTALRTLMPDSEISDREFADRFVIAAIHRGRNVAFDLTEEVARAGRGCG